jgi:hypothetical protein
MACNCGCHEDRVAANPPTGWRRFVPAVAGVLILVALIAGAWLKRDKQHQPAGQSAAASEPRP